eukprot:TRINITY_DN20114_c0_g1_i3.p1 TRINITY_DN20114_c0_g1~~TRINITY_DN20114_c0_g1_i3.p1  ORF type:complete len:100 (+),score=14.88 TRINITY_DN20114_c0_g1_i3:91-390(+)
MLRSLVGSEMCIRDRIVPPSQIPSDVDPSVSAIPGFLPRNHPPSLSGPTPGSSCAGRLHCLAKCPAILYTLMMATAHPQVSTVRQTPTNSCAAADPTRL